MRIAEIYHSIQGEGFLTGTPSIFIRVSGCNLRCWFCDTPYASWHPEGLPMAVADILERLGQWPDCQHVVITGGEPMLFAELVTLCAQLQRLGYHITVETAGTIDLPIVCDLMSISPKLANSTPSAATGVSPAWQSRHDQARDAPDVILRWLDDYTYQFKFVVDIQEDIPEIEAYLARYPAISRQRVFLMPQAIDQSMHDDRAAWLIPYCQTHKLLFCPRRQLEWFGLRRGT